MQWWENFLANLKKEFDGKDDKIMKVAVRVMNNGTFILFFFLFFIFWFYFLFLFSSRLEFSMISQSYNHMSQ